MLILRTCHSSNEKSELTAKTRTASSNISRKNENMMHHLECMQVSSSNPSYIMSGKITLGGALIRSFSKRLSSLPWSFSSGQQQSDKGALSSLPESIS
jgi:hypothetical protein